MPDAKLRLAHLLATRGDLEQNPRERLEAGPVADDDHRARAQSRGLFGEEALQDMGLARDKDGEPLRTGGREMDLSLQAEFVCRFPHALLDRDPIQSGVGPRGLQGHAELTAGDLFLHGLDIGAELEEKLGNSGDNAGLVMPDEGDNREMSGHGRKIDETVVESHSFPVSGGEPG